MSTKAIETALGYVKGKDGRAAQYVVSPTFVLVNGARIGGVRHYSFKPGEQRWHYHETNSQPHCTRTVLGSDIDRVAS